ncbi:MAG: nicotinate-nucleotide adenylyltransferase [Hyphomonas sp.]|nr:nicotinate-nucleotide adenylyltransferase [Hyphomonas sp.]
MSRTILPGPSSGLRIGLFGGSFNPAHSGHFHVASTALKRLQLDWVWWIVARGNPLKTGHGDFSERLASAQAVADHPRMRVTDIEARLGLTYSYRTLTTLKAAAPDAKFVWLMGADNMVSFHLWAEWQKISNLMPIAIVARPGVGPGARNSPFARRYAANRIPDAAAATLPDRDPPAWVYLPAPLDPISSTAIRQKKAEQ